MPETQNITYIHYLLGTVAFLSGSSIALIIFIAKKYIKRADCDHDRLNKVITEQDIFHKDDKNNTP